MNLETLVQMANGIGQFFDAMADRDEALDGVANHLRRYWAPAMRAQLLAGAQQEAAAALHPLVAEALRTRQPLLLPGTPAATGPR
jgi:formate dehydrogenase subunit delta